MHPPRDGVAPFHVNTPEIADVFRNVLAFKMLLHFMRPDGATVSTLADTHGLTLNAAYRKVKRLERLGLLRVLREEQRAGRAVRVYVAPHRAYFIPRTLVSLEEQMRETFEPYQELMRQHLARVSANGHNPVGGLLFRAEADGLWLIPATATGEKWRPDVPGTPAYYHGSGPLYLDYAQAKALERELYALFDRYRQQRGPHQYLMHAFLTPVDNLPNFAFPHAGYTDLV
ncbi:ArsR/SmtB family transcription factor [Deinococcus maricopensis]|uniref:Uncharacterized protein n=1 Tax=Deinococcus maricopensis (strain DSM 21211 / LMG 22137 / NRRL B-23946 / LB-34) TaxID=709986 RepID=E8U425_DEIML|nr:helix-turn-helix domain-containing protein [Deinococcus maricopensis]ADV65862.1 hypothetical protein Deima_0198 [Deinococcus maricopensis DSM 21211]